MRIRGYEVRRVKRVLQLQEQYLITRPDSGRGPQMKLSCKEGEGVLLYF